MEPSLSRLLPNGEVCCTAGDATGIGRNPAVRAARLRQALDDLNAALQRMHYGDEETTVSTARPALPALSRERLGSRQQWLAGRMPLHYPADPAEET